MDRFDIFQMISAVEVELREMGYELQLGKGVQAAEEAFLKGKV